MKTTDFLNLPAGTVVLLRPTERGTRVGDAYLELTLATIADDATYRKRGKWEPYGEYGNFIASPNGNARRFSAATRLGSMTEDPTPDANWRTVREVGATARDVVGVWSQVKERVLVARAAHFEVVRAYDAQRDAEHEDLLAKRWAAAAVVRDAYEVAGLPDLAHTAAEATFTIEQVADLVTALRAALTPTPKTQ